MMLSRDVLVSIRGRIMRADSIRPFQWLALAFLVWAPPAAAQEPESDALAEQRLELMRRRAQEIEFRSADPKFPERLETTPLFRYDDLTRGYLDGTVWRLGAKGRPRAIVTTELAPRYNGRPCVVYDFLSLSGAPFRASSADVPGWSPPESAVRMQPLPGGPAPAAAESARLFQFKQVAERFSATQDVEGQRLKLRLLPRPIDRYVPVEQDRADGAIFVFASGRMPGMVLLLETDGTTWSYGVGRLSHPSELAVLLDGDVVWQQPEAQLDWNLPYTAASVPATIPGVAP
jgi:hypothetical protein